jgi:hypothetical protein
MQLTTVLCMASCLFEFQPAVRNNILSRIQVDIFVHHAEGATYRKLCRDYCMCSQEALSRFFVRTTLEFHWSYVCQGGPLSFLSDLDIHKFEEAAIEHGRRFNCLSKSDALTLAFELRQQRIRLALELLRILRLDNLGERLLELYSEKEPDGHAVHHICDRINFKICRPQMLEFARRHCCDGECILAFLIHQEDLFHHDPRSIWRISAGGCAQLHLREQGN